MLQGTTIIEFEGLGPCPFAGAMLAELGARVIVIHRKSGEMSPAKSDQSPLDRGKMSIALDLKSDADIQIARDLCAKADAVIEGFRPGVMEKLGLGPDILCADTPRLVYGRMTGWGQDGPLAKTAGHDLNYIARTGALWYASDTADAPLTPPTIVGDIGGGALYLVIGVLSGLLSARSTGVGTVVDAAIVDGAAHMMNLLLSLQATGDLSLIRGQSLLDGPHWCRSYRCSDGRYISVQCLEPKFYRIFLDILGIDPEGPFKHQYDRDQWPDLAQTLGTVFNAYPQSYWIEKFDGTDACVAPVLSPFDAMNDPHIRARQIWENKDGQISAKPAPRFSNFSPRCDNPPIRDANRQEILAWLGSKKDKK